MLSKTKKLLIGIIIILIFFSYIFILRIAPTKTNEFQNAINNGQIDRIVSMIKENTNLVNTKTNYNFTPLQIALSNCNTRVVEVLIKNGANVNAEGGRHKNPPLITATIKNCTKSVEILINNGAEINGKNMLGETPLILGSQYGHTEIVKILVKYGADINIKKNKKTAIYYAIEKAHPDIVQILIKNSANSDIDSMIKFAKIKRLDYQNNDKKRKLELIIKILTSSKNMINK